MCLSERIYTKPNALKNGFVICLCTYFTDIQCKHSVQDEERAKREREREREKERERERERERENFKFRNAFSNCRSNGFGPMQLCFWFAFATKLMPKLKLFFS